MAFKSINWDCEEAQELINQGIRGEKALQRDETTHVKNENWEGLDGDSKQLAYNWFEHRLPIVDVKIMYVLNGLPIFLFTLSSLISASFNPFSYKFFVSGSAFRGTQILS